ncbi:MAG: dihydroneopterin aldolase [Acidimicrobiales bacterium]|nr:dihydroneopterin aldolase [Acidimicrobiales bacterium]
MTAAAAAGGAAASPPDVIELRGLELQGICGALPEERDRAQPLQVDLDVYADLSAAGSSDDLADTVDYGALCDVVARVVADGRPQLLEQLSTAVAAAVLAVDGRIDAVTVSVRKLRPPVPHALATSGVRIHRAR